MPSDFHTNDPQNLWKNQPTETFKMSTEQLRLKAQQLDRNGRRAVLSAAAIAITLFLYFGWVFMSFAGKFQSYNFSALGAWSVRVGFGVLSLWSLYSGYKTYKVFWPNHAASDEGLKTTVRFYRQQLEKRRDYSQNIWLRSGLIFCFLGMAMIVGPMLIRDLAHLPQLSNLAPLFALFILWLAIFIPQRKRRQRKLQQEIKQLSTFEREYTV